MPLAALYSGERRSGERNNTTVRGVYCLSATFNVF